MCVYIYNYILLRYIINIYLHLHCKEDIKISISILTSPLFSTKGFLMRRCKPLCMCSVAGMLKNNNNNFLTTTYIYKRFCVLSLSVYLKNIILFDTS